MWYLGITMVIALESSPAASSFQAEIVTTTLMAVDGAWTCMDMLGLSSPTPAAAGLRWIADLSIGGSLMVTGCRADVATGQDAALQGERLESWSPQIIPKAFKSFCQAMDLSVDPASETGGNISPLSG